MTRWVGGQVADQWSSSGAGRGIPTEEPWKEGRFSAPVGSREMRSVALRAGGCGLRGDVHAVEVESTAAALERSSRRTGGFSGPFARLRSPRSRPPGQLGRRGWWHLDRQIPGFSAIPAGTLWVPRPRRYRARRDERQGRATLRARFGRRQRRGCVRHDVGVVTTRSVSTRRTRRRSNGHRAPSGCRENCKSLSKPAPLWPGQPARSLKSLK